MKRVLLLLFAIGLLLPAQAQDTSPDESPLLAALALVPPRGLLDGGLYYADFAAALDARPAAVRYETWQDFEADSALAQRLWLASLPIGPSFVAFALEASLPDIDATMGFGLFDIRQAVQFGSPPSQGALLIGDFDAAQVAEAHAARGYTLASSEGVELWCYEGDCTGGMSIDFANRNVANLFGGELGRSQPIGIQPGVVLSTADDELLMEMVDAASGGGALADAPEVRALAEALAGLGQVRQALIVPPLLLYQQPADPLLPAATASEPLPLYTGVMLADVFDAGDELTVVALSYPDEASAARAAEVLAARLDTMETMAGGLWRDRLTERGVTSITTQVVVSEPTGLHVTLLVLRNPLPDDTALSADSQPASGFPVFRVLWQAFLTRDLRWLSE